MLIEAIKKFKKAIKGQSAKVVITTHHKPDADALGSSIGMKLYLEKLGHEVNVIVPSDYPTFLNWMPTNDQVINFETQKDIALPIIKEADMFFCLDFNALSRINDLGEVIADLQAPKIMIDHHLEPDDFADITISDISSAATAELIFQIIEEVGDIDLIDKEIGACLYAGIMTDTGSFRHPSTTKKCHQIAAHLIDIGLDVSKIHQLIYDNNSENRLKFLGYALSEKLKVRNDLGVAYFVFNKADLEKYHSQTGDTEGVVNYALSIAGIQMSAVIIERTDGVKMSFRSKGDFSVNEFARKYFNGGGIKMQLEENLISLQRQQSNIL